MIGISEYRNKFSAIKQAEASLREGIERALLNRYIELAGGDEGIEDILKRNGGLDIPLTIRILDDKDTYMYVNSLYIAHRDPLYKKGDFYLGICIAGENIRQDAFIRVKFTEFNTWQQLAILGGFEDMGFFDDSRRNLFPVI